MANLLVLLIIAACAAYQYFKGTFLKSFAMFITAVCAGAVAFGYFELLANFLIGRDKFVPWAQAISFSLLFVLAFGIFQAIAFQLTRQPTDTGLWPERIGRIVFAILSGLVISGIILAALVMAPLSNKLPYQRFIPQNLDAGKPDRLLLNADGFATGWFSLISSGSFSGKKSFAAVHPGFLDQAFLNRLDTGSTPIVAGSNAIEVPQKAAWPAPEGLTDSNGKTISPKNGYELIIVRVGIKTAAIKYGNTFTLSQLRLVCKQKSDVKNPLAGTGKNIYPLGYLKTAKQVEIKQLGDQIRLEGADFDNGVRLIDFVFEVPGGFLPVLAEFKQNSIVQVSSLIPADQAPAAMPFTRLSKCTSFTAEVEPVGSARVYGIQLAEAAKGLAGLSLQINNQSLWQQAQTDRSIKPAQFENGKISFVKAELKTEKPAPAAETAESDNVSQLLKPLEGYSLLSLKCSNPSTGTSIKAEQLPVLVGLTGSIHHPVGVAAAGKIGDQIVVEFDYCSVPAKDNADGLVIAENGAVAQPFPDTVWLTAQAQSISEFYVLYLVKAGENTVITSIQPGDSQVSAGFKDYEGFLIK